MAHLSLTYHNISYGTIQQSMRSEIKVNVSVIYFNLECGCLPEALLGMTCIHTDLRVPLNWDLYGSLFLLNVLC